MGGRPARILVWVFSIGSQAIMCVLFIILGTLLGGDQWRRPVLFVMLGGDHLQPEILFPCLAFTLAAVLSLVLVSTELILKKEEFLKLVRSNEEPEVGLIEEVIVSSPKTNEEGANLRCPKCGTNAGCEAYYNNSDNICYMTYCTKCVHEHGLYVRLETDEDEISKKAKNYVEAQNLKKETEASKIKEKCKEFVEFSLEESVGSSASDLNPVSRVLRADLITRCWGWRRAVQRRRCELHSGNWLLPYILTRTGTPRQERPLQRSNRRSVVFPKKHKLQK